MKSKLGMLAGTLIVGFVNGFFWLDRVTKPPRLWMNIQWQRLWAKFPVLRSDILHSSLTMTAFILLMIGTSSDVKWLTFAGFIALAITLTLGTVNLIYDFGEYNG